MEPRDPLSNSSIFFVITPRRDYGSTLRRVISAPGELQLPDSPRFAEERRDWPVPNLTAARNREGEQRVYAPAYDLHLTTALQSPDSAAVAVRYVHTH